MIKRYALASRSSIILIVLACLLLIASMAMTVMSFVRSTLPSSTVESRVSPTILALGVHVVETARPTLSLPSATPTIIAPTETPTLDPPTLTPAPPTEAPTLPPTPEVVLPTATATTPPAPPAPTIAAFRPDPNLLPNGVRYGDHKPDLAGRIVRIASPNIKLDASVYEVYIKKNTWEVADYAAGHSYNSANPGEGNNIVLSGHNNWRGEVFRYLENLKPGDIIQVWTQAGKEYDYHVTDIRKLKEAGVSMAQRLKNAEVMNPTGFEQLTLITCWPYVTYTHRIIVTALPVE
ncbi:MAG: sortase [Chloroflexota bacterium]